MVKDLPYPYTSKAQYERSLQTPIGTEWNTRLGFQRGTLPRVVKKVCYPSLPFEFALLMPALSPVLSSNLWSRCRRVFLLEIMWLHVCFIRYGIHAHICIHIAHSTGTICN